MKVGNLVVYGLTILFCFLLVFAGLKMTFKINGYIDINENLIVTVQEIKDSEGSILVEQGTYRFEVRKPIDYLNLSAGSVVLFFQEGNYIVGVTTSEEQENLFYMIVDSNQEVREKPYNLIGGVLKEKASIYESILCFLCTETGFIVALVIPSVILMAVLIGLFVISIKRTKVLVEGKTTVDNNN